MCIMRDFALLIVIQQNASILVTNTLLIPCTVWMVLNIQLLSKFEGKAQIWKQDFCLKQILKGNTLSLRFFMPSDCIKCDCRRRFHSASTSTGCCCCWRCCWCSFALKTNWLLRNIKDAISLLNCFRRRRRQRRLQRSNQNSSQNC